MGYINPFDQSLPYYDTEEARRERCEEIKLRPIYWAEHGYASSALMLTRGRSESLTERLKEILMQG